MERPTEKSLGFFQRALSNVQNDHASFAKAAMEVLNEAVGEKLGPYSVPNSKAIFTNKKMRIIDIVYSELTTINFNKTTVLQEIAAAAGFAIQQRLRILCIQSLARAGRKEAWRESDGVNLFHPAAYALMIGDRRINPPQLGQASHSTDRAIPGSGAGGKPIRIVLRPGTPVVDWAPRRPTTLEFGMWLPESMLAGIAGEHLDRVLGHNLTGQRAADYEAIRIVSAKPGGSKTNPKTVLELGPVRQTLMDGHPDAMELLQPHRAAMEEAALIV